MAHFLIMFNKKINRILFLSTIAFTIVFQSCAKNPLALKSHSRIKDGLFSPFSSEVISQVTPALYDGRLYFGTESGNLMAYNTLRNSNDWEFKSQNSIEGTAAILDKYVVFGNSEGNFYCIDRVSGKLNWEYHQGGEVLSKPAVNPDGIVYFSSADGVLTALDLHSGEWLWHYKRGLSQKVTIKGVSSPLLIEKEMIVLGFADGFVCALNPNDGTLLWEAKVGGEGRFLDVDATPIYSDGKIYVSSFEDGLFCLDKNGNILWKFDKRGGTSRVLLKGDFLYFTSNGGFAYKLEAKTGKEIWNFQFPKNAPTNPIFIDDKILFGTYSGILYLIKESDGSSLWQYYLGSELRGELLEDTDKIFAITSKGDLYTFMPAGLKQ